MKGQLTQRDMLFRLYDRVLGNGGSNMDSKVTELWEARHQYVTRADCAATRDAAGSKRRSTWLVVKDILLVAFAFFTLLVGSGVLRR